MNAKTPSIAALARPHGLVLALGAALLAAESAAALALPWLAGLLAGDLLDGGAQAFRRLLWAMLAVLALQALFKYAGSHVLDTAVDRMTSRLRARLYDRLQALPLAFHQERCLGDALAVLGNDVQIIASYAGGTAVAIVPLLLTALGSAAMMLRIEPRLALAALVLLPLLLLVLKIVGRRMRPLSQRVQDEEAHLLAMAWENLSMLPAIKTFTREGRESARFGRQGERVVELSARQRRIGAALGPGTHFAAAAGLVAILALAGADLAGGQLTAAALVSFLLYVQLLARPLAGLADVYGRTQAVSGALSRLRAIMDEPPERGGGTSMPRPRGEIEFRAVSFGYPGRSPAVIDLDLHVAPAETIAIVGPNGAGKSTVAHLLLRLCEPAAGSIHIDGTDISTVALQSLRGHIGIVAQHALLFNASVHDNIAYGRADATRAGIEAAARAAGAHDIITALPKGYETVIGDRGIRLSGGEQQRIALARALLKDPPILILDEATSMFDPAGERDFLRACAGMLRKRTVIVITHRPAMLETAHRIVHMERGRIVRIERVEKPSLAWSSSD